MDPRVQRHPYMPWRALLTLLVGVTATEASLGQLQLVVVRRHLESNSNLNTIATSDQCFSVSLLWNFAYHRLSSVEYTSFIRITYSTSVHRQGKSRWRQVENTSLGRGLSCPCENDWSNAISSYQHGAYLGLGLHHCQHDLSGFGPCCPHLSPGSEVRSRLLGHVQVRQVNKQKSFNWGFKLFLSTVVQSRDDQLPCQCTTRAVRTPCVKVLLSNQSSETSWDKSVGTLGWIKSHERPLQVVVLKDEKKKSFSMRHHVFWYDS